jgi:hypothetical protein
MRPATSAASASDALHRLANMPYLQGYRPATGGGVIRVHDRALSKDGLNFFTSSHAPVAILMDMDGSVVKTWSADAAKVFPGYVLERQYDGRERFLRDAELLPDGSILALFDQIGFVRLDAGSRVLWAWRGPVHHDLFVAETGNIWTLLHERRVVAGLRGGQPVLEDFALEFSPEGRLMRRISLVECFRRSVYFPMVASIRRDAGEDIFHTNSLVVLDGSLGSRSPAFRRGNLLVSLRTLSIIAVIDPDKGQVVWAMSGIWRGQHDAHLLREGRLLLFDNLGTLRETSRVLDLDPFTQQILWSFGDRPGEKLLSESGGAVERLPGGNTLITETNFGRVLEVTPDNRVVWEFENPNRVPMAKDPKKELVAIVYFMKRVGRDLPFLKSPAAGSLSGPPVSPKRPTP